MFGKKILTVGLLEPCPTWETKLVQDIVMHIECNGCPIAITSGTMMEDLRRESNNCAWVIFEAVPKGRDTESYSPNANIKSIHSGHPPVSQCNGVTQLLMTKRG